MKPSVQVFLGFVHRHGLHKLWMLIDELNTGRSLTRCAEMLDCDLAYLSRFVSRSLVKQYTLNPELHEMIDHIQRSLNANCDKALQRATVLSFRQSQNDLERETES